MLQQYLGFPIEVRMWWGRWRLGRVARRDAQPPEEHKMYTSMRL